MKRNDVCSSSFTGASNPGNDSFLVEGRVEEALDRLEADGVVEKISQSGLRL